MPTVIFVTANPKINPQLLQDEFDASSLPLGPAGSVNPYGYRLQDHTREVIRATENRALSTRNGVVELSADPGEVHISITRILTAGESIVVQDLLNNHNSTGRSIVQIKHDRGKQDKIDLQAILDSRVVLNSGNIQQLLRFVLYRN